MCFYPQPRKENLERKVTIVARHEGRTGEIKEETRKKNGKKKAELAAPGVDPGTSG